MTVVDARLLARMRSDRREAMRGNIDEGDMHARNGHPLLAAGMYTLAARFAVEADESGTARELLTKAREQLDLAVAKLDAKGAP